MVNWVDTVSALENYKKYVLRSAKRRLRYRGIKGSSNLYSSLRAIVAVKQSKTLKGLFSGGKQPQITFKMNDYGHFVDQGVKGTEDKDVDAYDKPFAFKSSKKSIPWSVVDGFLSSKARLKDKKTGKFKAGSRNTLLFLIGRSIHQKGIKRSLFLTNPLDKGREKFESQVADGAANDITREFVSKLKIYFKDNKTIK